MMTKFGDQAKALCTLIVTGTEALLDEAELVVPILVCHPFSGFSFAFVSIILAFEEKANF
jgi:hypothetical protein